MVFWLTVTVGLVYAMNVTHWKEYKNQEYGFSISLPKDFTIQPNSYSPNDSTQFSFTIVDPENLHYLTILAYDKPSDYKEPRVPFPEITSNEKTGASTSPYIFNNIEGFRTEGGWEGAGGTFDYFQFIHDNKVWNIEFSVEDGHQLSNVFDKKIYTKIRDSFTLL